VGGRGSADGEGIAVDEDAEEGERDFVLERHRDLVTRDDDLHRAQTGNPTVASQRLVGDRPRPRRVELHHTLAQRAFVDAVRRRGRDGVGHGRQFPTCRDPAPEVDGEAAQEEQGDTEAEHPQRCSAAFVDHHRLR
jgi:hypothetical protein